MSSNFEVVSMPKALTYTGLAVSALLILIFGLDAALGIPFKKASLIFDVGMILCALIIGYLGWSSLRDLS